VAALTLVVALVWGSGVLVTSDSRASTGLVFHEERKVYPIYSSIDGGELDLAIAAGAGDAALVKQGFKMVEGVFREWLSDVGEPRNPSLGELEAIVSRVEERLMERYRRLRSLGVDVDASLLLASVSSEGRPVLYTFDSRGLAEPRHDNPGYALLGTGAITGGLLLLRLLDYTLEKAAGWDLGLLSAFLIDAVSEVDPHVSPFLGESWLIRYDPHEAKVVMGPLREEAYREYKRRIRERRRLIALLWDILERLGAEGEAKVEEAIRAVEGR
jgi:hypothetical protein